MSKSRFIGLRISENDYRKIEAMRNGKSITDFFRELITFAVEKDKQEASEFIELLKKIEATDLSKIIERLNGIERRLDELQQTKPQQLNLEPLKQLILLFFELIREHGRLIFVMPDKAKMFMQFAADIEQKIKELITE